MDNILTQFLALPLILCYISFCQAINLIFMLCPEIASLKEGNLNPIILNEEEGDFRAKYKNKETAKQHI